MSPDAPKSDFGSIGSLLKSVAEESRKKGDDDALPIADEPEPGDDEEFDSVSIDSDEAPEEALAGLPADSDVSGDIAEAGPDVVGGSKKPLLLALLFTLLIAVLGAGAWLELKPQAADTRYETAAGLLLSGDDVAARELYAACRKEEPSDPRLYTVLARAYLQRAAPGDAAAALELVKNVILGWEEDGREVPPPDYRNRAALELMVQAGIASGNLADAERGSRDLMRLYYDETIGYKYQARVEMARGDYAEAIAFLRQGEFYSKEDPDVYQLLRRVYLLSGQYEQGLKVNETLQQLQAEIRGESDYIDLITLLLATDSRQLVTGYLESGLRQYPKSVPLLKLDIQVAYDDHRYERVVEQAGKLVEYTPQSPEGYYYAGQGEYAQGHTAEALRWYRQAESVDPQYVPALIRLGDVSLFTLDRPQEAKNYYEQAARFGGEVADIFFGWGLALYRLAEYYDAAEQWERARDAEPLSRKIAYDLATVNLVLQRLDEARRLYEECLNVGAVQGRVHNNLGVIAELQGDETEALRYYMKAKDIDSWDTNLSLPIARQNFDRYFRGAKITDPRNAMDMTVLVQEPG